MNPLIAVPAALFGLSAGSFLNVVIYRLPAGRSVIRPGSACPECRHRLSWYENLPVASYIFLRGRCRGCGSPIPLRYPLVELLGMSLALLSLYRFGPGIDAAFAYAFLMALLAITFIDWDHRIIPDQISLTFIVIGVAWSFFNPGLSFSSSILGAVAGGGGLWLIGLAYRLIRRTEGMGGGDVKLMGMVGAFLGLGLVLPVIVLASFFGSIYGTWLLRRGGEGRTAVAFGSFLAPAAALCLIFGQQILSWYFGRF